MILEDGIEKVLNTAELRFNTPGHKGQLLKHDITETDNLFPNGLIEKAQNKTAKILGVRALRYLYGGSSLGIKAACLALGNILCAKNSHQSVYEAAKLSGCRIVTVNNLTQNGLKQPLTAKQIKTALKKYPFIETVVLTSPDYYGLTASIEAAKIIKDEGKTLYIDAAHGAHFLFRPDLFDCEIFKYADAFNLSAHKTLFSLTQTAYLCISNKDFIKKIDENLRLMGTTSPFYPFYSSLEYAADYTKANKSKYDELKQAVINLKKKINCAQNNDFTRLVVDAYALETDGKKLFYYLLNKGVIAEKYDGRYVIFIITIADKTDDILRLENELLAAGRAYGGCGG